MLRATVGISLLLVLPGAGAATLHEDYAGLQPDGPREVLQATVYAAADAFHLAAGGSSERATAVMVATEELAMRVDGAPRGITLQLVENATAVTEAWSRMQNATVEARLQRIVLEDGLERVGSAAAVLERDWNVKTLGLEQAMERLRSAAGALEIPPSGGPPTWHLTSSDGPVYRGEVLRLYGYLDAPQAADRPLELWRNGEPWLEARTDGRGFFEVTYRIPEDAPLEPWTVRVVSAGEGPRAESEALPLNVTRMPTRLVASLPSGTLDPEDDVTLAVGLKDARGRPVQGEVEATLPGDDHVTGVTDASGHAILKHAPKAIPQGEQKIVVRYAGSPLYAPNESTVGFESVPESSEANGKNALGRFVLFAGAAIALAIGYGQLRRFFRSPDRRLAGAARLALGPLAPMGIAYVAWGLAAAVGAGLVALALLAAWRRMRRPATPPEGNETPGQPGRTEEPDENPPSEPTSKPPVGAGLEGTFAAALHRLAQAGVDVGALTHREAARLLAAHGLPADACEAVAMHLERSLYAGDAHGDPHEPTRALSRALEVSS